MIQKQWEKAVSLPMTPWMGEYVDVEIQFGKTSYSFSIDDKYYSGYVHDVRHTIIGTTQEILILIYPFKNIYYKWEEMKKEYEDKKQWLARLSAEKD